mmetsp:Transcript_14379/g.21221  ORF Transcript_14379/g.21221 Transcript_14379/m.21221 type:complete len:487 (+) Transcript_14379:113-1573(+)
MIEYGFRVFGFGALGRVQGSAVYRSIIPALLSVTILLVFTYGFDHTSEDFTQHPYVYQVLVAAVTFLITFRTNFAYGRYWDATTGIHFMLSKWLDTCVTMAAFHYQSSRYDDKKPPSFGKHPEIRRAYRVREHLEFSEFGYLEKLENDINDADQRPHRTNIVGFLSHERKKNIAQEGLSIKNIALVSSKRINTLNDWVPSSLTRPMRDETLTSPLLNEAVHLFSLLSAVAMATLRKDTRLDNLPFIRYQAGNSFPPVDPNKMDTVSLNRLLADLCFILGISRGKKYRSRHSSIRQFGVLGGISEKEVQALKQARGEKAKVALCFMWVQEFMIREQLSSGLGQIPSAIVSRCFQFASDGMKGFNECQKVALTPFPFPHAQLTIFFNLVVICYFPFLFFAYVNDTTMGCIMNFITVLCLHGLHEVAIELEDPFCREPNNLPLTTFQAQFNEALLTTWAGFHPDSFLNLPPEDSCDKDEEMTTIAEKPS